MLYLVDTGVLLRLFHRTDPLHSVIRRCLRDLRSAGHRFALSPQNVAEFWNVSTRPATARGGFGLSVEQAEQRLRFVERIFEILPDSPEIYAVWRRLVVEHQVKGVQVHDARLVAWMETQAIEHLITLNGADFARFDRIVAHSPETLGADV